MGLPETRRAGTRRRRPEYGVQWSVRALCVAAKEPKTRLPAQNTRARDTGRAMHLDEWRLVFNSPSGSMPSTRAQHTPYPHTS